MKGSSDEEDFFFAFDVPGGDPKTSLIRHRIIAIEASDHKR
jgi:hypothetical protein